MEKLKSKSVQLILIASAAFLGLGFIQKANAQVPYPGGEEPFGPFAAEEQALIDRVIFTNVGWDWVPSCGDDSVWDTCENRCRSKGHSDNCSYRISNPEQLIATVRMVNAGWDWEPRCANGAKWSWSCHTCKGGTD